MRDSAIYFVIVKVVDVILVNTRGLSNKSISFVRILIVFYFRSFDRFKPNLLKTLHYSIAFVLILVHKSFSIINRYLNRLEPLELRFVLCFTQCVLRYAKVWFSSAFYYCTICHQNNVYL